MIKPLRRRSLLASLVFILATLALLGAGCDDASSTGDGDDTGSGDTGGDTTATPDGDDDTGADTAGDTGADGDTGGDDTAGDTTDTGGDTTGTDTSDTTEPGDATDATDALDMMDTCTGTLCGQPAMCCPMGNECIEGACLPSCDSGVRCGADQMICCAGGEVCLAGTCAAPGLPCSDSYDCLQPGEFCEPTLGQCLPQPNPLTCTLSPSFSTLSATLEESWTDEEVISPPFVADVDGNGVPDIVVNAAKQDALGWPGGMIVVLEGVGLTELWRMPHDPTNNQVGSHGRSSIGLGDVSGDGLPDIIFAGREPSGAGGPIHAVDGFGNLLWTAHDSDGAPVLMDVENGAPTLANFDDDPMAEIVFGASLIDHDGLVVWREPYGATGAQYASRYGSNAGYVGGISAVADLDGDSLPEIVSGRNAWDVLWAPPAMPGLPPTVQVAPLWVSQHPNDGYPAIADLDGNGTPEVVIVASGAIVALDGQSGEYWCGVDATGAACDADDALRTAPVAIPGGGLGGPPTIADFDADGRPEVGVAGGSSYSVYDFNRAGEDIVSADGTTPVAGAAYVRWSQPTKDQSSNVTGSSVFDFQGDGSAEVVYADECYMRVYSGADGTVQLTIENNSATIHEYPLVVDADADGNSEILIVANRDGACLGVDPNHAGPMAGVFMFGDANDEWVPTRRVWTQHTYHVTNATSDGNVPLLEANSWTTSGVNNYRQNVQGEGVFNAPDLELSLSVGLAQCPQGNLVLLARVSNAGALGVPAGVEVRFFEGSDTTGTFLGSATTTESLLPGASTVVSITYPDDTLAHDFFAVVDGDDASAGIVTECDESNNGDATTSAQCQIN